AIAAAISASRLASRAIRALRARMAGPRQAQPTLADPALAVVSAGATGPAVPGGVGGHGASGLADATPPAAGPGGSARPGPRDGPPAEPGRRRRRLARELAALGWIWVAIAASYLFGFEIGAPLAAATYGLTSVSWSRRWARLSYAAVVTGVAFAIAYSFVSLFSLTFTGLLT
ncbi:MAG TPA: hypothetical protein VMU95_20775, partial [Trebonia sp.]|nr:hypothetical protein [Trebonia sp.]